MAERGNTSQQNDVIVGYDYLCLVPVHQTWCQKKNRIINNNTITLIKTAVTPAFDRLSFTLCRSMFFATTVLKIEKPISCYMLFKQRNCRKPIGLESSVRPNKNSKAQLKPHQNNLYVNVCSN